MQLPKINRIAKKFIVSFQVRVAQKKNCNIFGNLITGTKNELRLCCNTARVPRKKFNIFLTKILSPQGSHKEGLHVLGPSFFLI